MILVSEELCTGCRKCELVCPVQCITMEGRLAVVDNSVCVDCNACVRVCYRDAMVMERTFEDRVLCDSCPVECLIPEGHTGSCGRYRNNNGRRELTRRLVIPQYDSRVGSYFDPLVTGVGAGTEYPDCRPAPYIVEDSIDGVDVVTVVTDTPLSYSNIQVKIDSDAHVGNEGAVVRRDGRPIGMVITEQYGAKILSIGGGNTLTGAYEFGAMASRTVADICNGERVKLKVQKGATLEVQLGKPPVIDGVEYTKMRVGCGSATVGMFAAHLKEVVDEAIILDHLVTGLLSEHKAGEDVGLKFSGVTPYGRKSTRGRYFGDHGSGWGGTVVMNPRDAIRSVDMTRAREGMTILVTETTGQNATLFRVNGSGVPEEIPMPEAVSDMIRLLAENCEDSRVSVILMGGIGGSARAGVTRNPIKLTQAVHQGLIRVTIGGARAFVLPGGNITFNVDVEKMVPKCVTWVPTPAPCVPVEYTMTKEVFRKIGGHMDHIRHISDVISKQDIEYVRLPR